MKKWLWSVFLLLTFVIFGKEVKIVFLETSDIHGRLFSYDYAIDEQKDNNGLTRVATILKQQRKENKNVIVIDNGDLLQDNSAELFNDEPVHPLMRTLNDLKYDVFVLGNHEFNFEKTFLERNIKAFKGAVLASNVIKKSDNEGKIKEVDLEYRN